MDFCSMGFPRTIPQARALESADVEIDVVVEITVPDKEIVLRMSGRRVHPGSGRTYHIEFNPPKTPNTDDETLSLIHISEPTRPY